MKSVFFLTIFVITVLVSGCGLLDSKEKEQEIIQLQTALAVQQGSRAAELEFGERQASFYLGCKAFFNRCSEETTALGQQLLQNGFTGNISGWYWMGLLGKLAFLITALVVGSTIFRHFYLTIIKPKEEEVLRAQRLVDEVDDYMLKGNQWKAAHAQEVIFQKVELAKIVAEKTKIKKERDSLYQSILDAYAELETLQYRIGKTNSSKKIDLDEL